MVKGEVGRRAKVMSLGCQEGTARVWGMIATGSFLLLHVCGGVFISTTPTSTNI